MIRNWKPWEKSTGPRTDEGKARTSRNPQAIDPGRCGFRLIIRITVRKGSAPAWQLMTPRGNPLPANNSVNNSPARGVRLAGGVGALLVLILILLVRPYGLLGRRERVG